MIDQLGFPLPIAVNTPQGANGRQTGTASSGQNWLDLLTQPAPEAVAQAEPVDRTVALPASQLPTNDASIELVVVSAGGAQESRTIISLPWRLAANQSVDQRGWGQRASASATSPSSVSVDQDCVLTMPTPEGVQPPLVQTSPIFKPPSSDHCFPFPTSDRPRIGDLGRHRTEHSSSAPSGWDAPTTETWSERLVRLFGQDRGKLAIWVRDYAIRERDERSVVAAIRDHCARNNVHVERIAINGHVLWSARPQMPSEEAV